MSVHTDVFGGAIDAKGRHILTTGPIDRPHYAAVVTGSTDDAVWKRLMREWYGLTPARGLNWYYWADCPHRIVGMRCPSAFGPDHRVDKDYRCHRWHWDHNELLWDHARAWRNADGELVITLEPYGNPYDMTSLVGGVSGS